MHAPERTKREFPFANEGTGESAHLTYDSLSLSLRLRCIGVKVLNQYSPCAIVAPRSRTCRILGQTNSKLCTPQDHCDDTPIERAAMQAICARARAISLLFLQTLFVCVPCQKWRVHNSVRLKCNRPENTMKKNRNRNHPLHACSFVYWLAEPNRNDSSLHNTWHVNAKD